ncbi:PREDICTED: histone chaperone ASF1-like [Drosophila arizonae]|uniref:Histone chaperone ASF1-like n=1 Tax=Drosophila arizonae TaxID=7263 RepID=A0ABM1NTG2_DROAR|nr:PREDICTED: histone chaperone ASF1-like [Drosophila arizonae]
MAEPMAELKQEEQHEQHEQQQQELELEVEQQQLAEAQDGDTMAHNEETEMPLPDSDSHNASQPESLAAIENFGDALDDELAAPQSEQLYREREELESSDDDDERATPVEMSETFNDEWATLDEDAAAVAAADPDNDLNNHIDIYESFAPVDLSNDIAVNDLAAANPNYPYNPDAELIELPASSQTMQKFEKLSLLPPTPATALMK